MSRRPAIITAILIGVFLWGSTAGSLEARTTPNARSDNVRKIVTEVLSGPDFAPLQRHNSGIESLGKRVFDWLARLAEWLDRLFRFGAPGSAGTASNFLRPLVIVLIAGLVFMLVYAIAKRKPVTTRKTSRKAGVIDYDTLEGIDSRNSDEWLSAAQQLSKNGDYRKALRAIFVATLIRLDAAGIVTYEQFRTNGEYLRATRKHASFFSQFNIMVNAFDAGWYGNMPVSESVYRQGLESYNQADTLARTRQN
jgi:hypothetical protein